MTPEELLNFIALYGFPLVISGIVTYIGYKYAMMRLKLMKAEFEDRLKSKYFHIVGNISTMADDGMNKTFIDLKVVEVPEEKR